MTRRSTAAPRADAARNIERILEAARTAFREQGPSVPFYEIARSAGVGQATLYRHFPNKQALVRKIVEENTGLLEEATSEIRSGGFDRVFEKLTALIAENPELSALMAAEVGSDWYDQMIGRIVDILDVALREGQDAGELRRELDRTDLQIVLHMVGGAVTGDTLDQRGEQARRACRVVLDGMRRPDREVEGTD